jgi:signal transduction histidine kinase
MRCHSLEDEIPKNRTDLRKQIADICEYLRDSISQTRALARGLSPVKLGSGGLIEALEDLAVRMSVEGRIQCRFTTLKADYISDIQTANHLFRITQEAVNNAVKHSGASEITISLMHNAGATILGITDNGKGLKNTKSRKGIGLEIMQQRASVIGARLAITSKFGKGTTVTCLIENPKK